MTNQQFHLRLAFHAVVGAEQEVVEPALVCGLWAVGAIRITVMRAQRFQMHRDAEVAQHLIALEWAARLDIVKAGVGENRKMVRSRSEEHTSELQSLMRNSYAVFCLKKKKSTTKNYNH